MIMLEGSDDVRERENTDDDNVFLAVSPIIK